MHRETSACKASESDSDPELGLIKDADTVAISMTVVMPGFSDGLTNKKSKKTL